MTVRELAFTFPLWYSLLTFYWCEPDTYIPVHRATETFLSNLAYFNVISNESRILCPVIWPSGFDRNKSSYRRHTLDEGEGLMITERRLFHQQYKHSRADIPLWLAERGRERERERLHLAIDMDVACNAHKWVESSPVDRNSLSTHQMNASLCLAAQPTATETRTRERPSQEPSLTRRSHVIEEQVLCLFGLP